MSQLKVLFLQFIAAFTFCSVSTGQVLFGPESVRSADGALRTLVRTIDLGDNLPGVYLLKLQNGSNGPALLLQCGNQPSIELKRQCQYDNLVDRLENQLARVNSLVITVNGKKLSPTSLLNKSTSYLEFPILLGNQTNEVKISVQGNPEAFADVSLETMPESLIPRTLFSLNSNYGRAPFKMNFNAAKSFDPMASALTYEWFINDVKVSILKASTYTFQDQGEYNLKLKVKNLSGVESELETTIVVLSAIIPPTNKRPIPKLSITRPDPLNLRLIRASTQGSTDPDGFITQTLINFGDGSIVSGTDIVHQYTGDGTFLVSVRQTDNLGAAAVIDQSVSISQNSQLSKVATIYGANQYYGSFSSYNLYQETFNVTSTDLNELYRIRVKNGDGKDHLIKTCAGTISEKIMCAYNNLLSRTYIAFNRVDYAQVYLNNKRITDSSSINKNKKYFETFLKLSEVNQLKIKLKGWPTAYVEVEIEKLGEVADTTAPLLASDVESNTITRSNLVHVTIDDNSDVTTLVYKDDVLVSTVSLKEFDLTLTEGANNFVLKSIDAVENTATDFILSNIVLDSTAPVISALNLKTKYVFESLPQTISLDFSANEDIVSATANGEDLIRTNDREFRYDTKTFNDGKIPVVVKMKDLVGNEGSATFYVTTETDTLAPVLTMTALPALTKATQLNVNFRVTEKNDVTTVVKLNGNVIATSVLKSFTEVIQLLVEGINTIEAVSTDSVGHTSNIISSQVVRDTTGPQLTVTPAPSAVIGVLNYTISGTSNEPMIQVLVNAKAAILSADKKSFSIAISNTTYGIKPYSIQSKDNLGNLSIIQVSYSVQNGSIALIASSVPDGSVVGTNQTAITVTGPDVSNVRAVLNGSEVYNGSQTNFNVTFADEGANQLQITAKNSSNQTASQVYNFTYDNSAPILTIGQVPVSTRLNEVLVPFSVSDVSMTNTVISVNGIVHATVHEKNFSYMLPLTEGMNTITAVSTDVLGNKSSVVSKEIVRDTVGPVLSDLIPNAGSTNNRVKFLVSGKANEALESITVNGMNLALASDKLSFSGNYVAANQGSLILTFVATDLVGNVTSTTSQISIDDPLLVPSLVNVIPDGNTNYYKVVGMAGAARQNSTITVSAGYLSFNRGTDIAKVDGSFSVRLTKFSTVNVYAKDLDTNQEASFDLSFNLPTTISGVVKDTDDTALPNATVRILGSSINVVTDSSGVFIISNAPIGDQVLSIDGSTVSQPSNGPARKFSVSNIAVAISPGQVNSLSKPVFLTSSVLDGSGTTVATNTSAVVTDVNAPGVSLVIPPNAAVFPDGQHGGHISMKLIPASRTVIPVPAAFIPDQVIALEPSGLKFSQPVEITIPNVNSLKENTEVYILSMNSTTGVWEIDGLAKVDSGGSTIKSKPGYGIKHFSPVYAVPVMPVIEGIADPNLDGIDTAKGGMETSVTLPSFRTLGNTVTPALRYKSGWAAPTALVSNVFDIPKAEIKFTDSQTYSDTNTKSVQQCFLGLCSSKDYVTEFYRRDDYSFSSAYIPDEISAQTWVGINSTDDQTYEVLNPSEGASSLPGVTLTNTVASEKWTLINDTEGTLIPSMAQISFALPLKKDANNYLKSGMYPSFTRFQVKLKHLTITTRLSLQTVKLNGEIIRNYSYENSSRDVKTAQLDDILPTDISRNILVQNQSASAAGRGWIFRPSQKLLNTKGSKILLEDAQGELSTYTFASPIETIFAAGGSDIDLTSGAGLSSWPNIYVSSYGVDRVARVKKIDGENPSSISIASKLEALGGTSGFDKTDDCLSSDPNARSVKLYKFSFVQKPGLSNVVMLPNGRLIASDSATNSINDITSSVAFPLAGFRKQSVVGNPFNFNTGASGFATNYQDLCNTMKFDCFNLTAVTPATQSCSATIQPHDETGTLAMARTSDPGGLGNDYTGGRINGSGAFGKANFSDIGLNNPGGMILSPDGKIVVADTGANVVYKINVDTGTMKVLAGNYAAQDAGDGGLAAPDVLYDLVMNLESTGNSFVNYLIKQSFFKRAQAAAANAFRDNGGASIYHPKGLAYDSSGNLYISSENGLIRRVDTDGKITTYAGALSSNGGVEADAIHAELMIFRNPTGIIIDQEKNEMFIADTGNHRIVKIDMATKMANSIAGRRECKLDPNDGPSALNAYLCSPTWLGFDSNKNVVFVDSVQQRIRKITLNSQTSNKLSYVSSNGDLSILEKNDNGSFIRKFRNGSQFFFDQKGLQISAVDRVGRTETYNYDNQDRLTSVVDISGQISNFNYSGDKLVSFVDPANRTTQFNYSGPDLSQIIFPDGNAKSFEYDVDGRMTKEFNERGYKKEYLYNTTGRLASVKDFEDNLTQVSDVQSQTLNTPKREGLLPNTASNTVIAPNSTTLSLTKDSNGFISKIKDQNGHTTQITTNLKGKPLLVLKEGAATAYKYDPQTQDVIEVSNQVSGTKTEQVYNSFGQIISATDFKTNVESNVYAETTGLLIRKNLPDGSVIDYTYNSNGQVLTKTSYPAGSTSLTTSYTYQNGNLKTQNNPDGKGIIYEYDAAGNVIKSISSSSANLSAITFYEYDAMNRLTKVTNPEGAVTAYQYSSTGKLTAITDPKGQTASFTYNKNDQVKTRTTSDGRTYTYFFDALGNPIKEIDPNQNELVITYFPDNKLKSTQTVDETMYYQYDAKDRLSVVDSTSGISVSMVYDSNDRLIQENNFWTNSGRSFTNNYEYDENGNRTSAISTSFQILATAANPNGGTQLNRIYYGYDQNNQLKSLSNYWGDNFSFNYDYSSRLLSVTRPGSRTDYLYNVGSSLTKIIHSTSGVTKSFIEFAYDRRNLITQQRMPSENFDYTYDLNGQLKSAVSSLPGGVAENFEYDTNGNRTSSGGVASNYDSSFQKIVDDGSYVYVHDENGNIIYKNSKTSGMSYSFQYTARNLLKRVTILASPLSTTALKIIEYSYDPLGRRIQKKVSDFSNANLSYEKNFVYDEENIVAEFDKDGRLLASYTHAPNGTDELLSANFTSHAVPASLGGDAISEKYVLSNVVGRVYFLKDHHNSITDIIDGSGNIVQRNEYSAFGVTKAIRDISGTIVNESSAPVKVAFRYTGREFEEETGLYYYRARYYDPTTGRFLQKDPDPGKLANPNSFISKYIYAGNNPVSFNDPSGKFFFLAVYVIAWAASTYIESAIVAGILVGIAGSFAAVEATKYNFNTKKMMDNETPGSLMGIAAIGALSGGLGAWAGAGTVSGLSPLKNSLYWSWVPQTAGGFVAGSVSGVVATAGMGATHITQATSQDYLLAFSVGGLLGGVAGASNHYFYTSFSTPIGFASEGSTFFLTNTPTDSDNSHGNAPGVPNKN